MSNTYGGSHLVMDVARYFRIYLLSCIAILLGQDKELGRFEDKPWISREKTVELAFTRHGQAEIISGSRFITNNMRQVM